MILNKILFVLSFLDFLMEIYNIIMLLQWIYLENEKFKLGVLIKKVSLVKIKKKDGYFFYIEFFKY